MSCPSEIAEILLEILEWGIMIRILDRTAGGSVCRRGRPLHNLLIFWRSITRSLLYYWDVERAVTRALPDIFRPGSRSGAA